MKVCIFGAGAVGGHFAARLAKGGADVSLVSRGANLLALRERGLEVHTRDGVLHCRPRASDMPADLGEQDAVIVTVKAPALPQLAQGIAPLLGPRTMVVFAMNGIPWWYFERHGGASEGRRIPEVDPGEAVRRAVGVERVIGGVVYSACTVTEPGVVHVETADNRLILGEPDGSLSERVQALAAILEAGGLKAPVSGDIRREIWTKLLGNISNGPLCILTRQGAKDTLSDPAIAAAAERMVAEAQAIAEALGRPVSGDPFARIARAATLAHKPSILQDLELGRPMEIAAMLAVPLRLGREAGVATPMLDLMVALASKVSEAAGLYAPR